MNRYSKFKTNHYKKCNHCNNTYFITLPLDHEVRVLCFNCFEQFVIFNEKKINNKLLVNNILAMCRVLEQKIIGKKYKEAFKISEVLHDIFESPVASIVLAEIYGMPTYFIKSIRDAYDIRKTW